MKCLFCASHVSVQAYPALGLMIISDTAKYGRQRYRERKLDWHTNLIGRIFHSRYLNSVGRKLVLAKTFRHILNSLWLVLLFFFSRALLGSQHDFAVCFRFRRFRNTLGIKSIYSFNLMVSK